MRKLVVLTFVSLDGVMQAPGGPEEDTSGNFAYGGWTVPYFDETLGAIMDEQMTEPFDLLLGRKTFQIFEAYWPEHHDDAPGINNATKYVASNTVTSSDWATSVFLSGDVVEQVRQLKAQDGPDLQVHGSADFIQTLLAHDLVDEFWLKIFPVVLGSGKRLFGGSAIPEAFVLASSAVTPTGVIVANYRRGGEIETGSF